MKFLPSCKKQDSIILMTRYHNGTTVWNCWTMLLNKCCWNSNQQHFVRFW